MFCKHLQSIGNHKDHSTPNHYIIQSTNLQSMHATIISFSTSCIPRREPHALYLRERKQPMWIVNKVSLSMKLREISMSTDLKSHGIVHILTQLSKHHQLRILQLAWENHNSLANKDPTQLKKKPYIKNIYVRRSFNQKIFHYIFAHPTYRFLAFDPQTMLL